MVPVWVETLQGRKMCTILFRHMLTCLDCMLGLHSFQIGQSKADLGKGVFRAQKVMHDIVWMQPYSSTIAMQYSLVKALVPPLL